MHCTDSDSLEDNSFISEHDLLDILLYDHSSHRNIIWATNEYSHLGDPYRKTSRILPSLITGDHSSLIQPRAAKPSQTQQKRIRDRGEVFTPSWVCNLQNNLIDDAWFGRSHVFNRAEGSAWVATEGAILFDSEVDRDWRAYVSARRMEITCGEAPYLVSRRDVTTGKTIPLRERIGMLDRKLRVVGENTTAMEDWITWATRAVQSIYGFEFQGDSLLLARENVVMTFIEYFLDRYDMLPDDGTLRSIAETVSWNLWQMDGLKYVLPFSCTRIIRTENSLLGEKEYIMPCPGCDRNDRLKHTGIYSLIMDWDEGKPVRYIDLLKGKKSNGNV